MGDGFLGRLEKEQKEREPFSIVTHSVAARSLWSGTADDDAEEAIVVVVDLSSVMAVPIPLTTMPVSPSKSNLI